MAKHGTDYDFLLMNCGKLWQPIEIGRGIWNYGRPHSESQDT
jgi:hypothetical protein